MKVLSCSATTQVAVVIDLHAELLPRHDDVRDAVEVNGSELFWFVWDKEMIVIFLPLLSTECNIASIEDAWMEQK